MKWMLVMLFGASVSTYATVPSFTDCADALSQGKSFVQSEMALRRKILSQAIRGGTYANVESSRAFRALDHNWYLAANYMLTNKCDAEFDELQLEKNYLGVILQADLQTLIETKYGTASFRGCTGAVTLFNPAGCY